MATTTTPPQDLKADKTAGFGDEYDLNGTPHVFYPLYLGEVLDERYLVEHKIGFGGFSTVWMAHDLKTKRDVALKIFSLGEWGEHETHMQNEILQNVQDTSNLVTCSATFLLPSGSSKSYHRVLVLPLLGPCITSLILDRMALAIRMSAAKQLLEALERIHQAGIIHRDLNESNCMWGMAPLHNLSRTAKYEALGRPLKEVIPYVNLWKQGELVQPIEVPQHLYTEKFYLGDFGLSMKLGDLVIQKGYPPMPFCSPDRLHRQGPSFACDMWSYMVIFSRLYFGYLPFPDQGQGGEVSSMVKCLGPLPEQWKGLYTHSRALDSCYDQRQIPDPKYSLAAKISKFRPEADQTEQKHMLSIVSKVFTFCPQKRLTATQLLHDPSFKAVMEKYGC
ncbi:serine/threonine protein kinase [Emergomyces africanus]|uniref:Serine/threonine protein kinase n=1 Tax=Emergomyces africanus TaxID=1955775 RepID=A0A1B7NR73_9EURO|nr:serine/threonine protein kinase [Emergomyces africanus]